MKKCRDCEKERPISEFFRNKVNKDGFQNWCKFCHRQRMKTWEINNPEKVKECWKRSNYKRCKKNCPYCGKEYVGNSREEGCSLKCRFFLSIQINQETNCWEWQKSLCCGYGQMNERGKLIRMHRRAYEMFKEKIPKGKNVLHKCDNRKCCNPDHLYIGTQSDNMKDRYHKRWNLKENNNGKKTLDKRCNKKTWSTP